jgi:DNA-binding NarL/FixJ family response regulator
MKARELLSQLRSVKPCEGGWMACCPAHDDRRPSLSVTEKDGRILLKCFAGCANDSVVTALGLSMSDLFSDSGKGAARPEKKIVAEYDFVDETGKPLTRTIRFEPKGFSQQHWDGSKWVWGLNGNRCVPYRLPQVLAAETVYVVEGEKDANTLGDHGFTATCNPMGAGKWRSEYNQYFQGKAVVIIPDNDPPGRKHAEHVAAELYAVAKEVVMLDLPGGKDATDFIEAGGSFDDICDLVQRAETWLPTIPTALKPKKFSSLLKVQTANEWIEESKNRPIPKKLCGSLWIQDEMCILFGGTGLGKSALAVQIGASLTEGKAIDEAFEMGVNGLRVLYLDCELSPKQFEGRYSKRIEGSDYYAEHYKFSDNFKRAEIMLDEADLDSPVEFQDQLQRSIAHEIAKYEIDALIVDNITWLRDETEKAKAALPLMKALVSLKRRYKISILVLAHTPKRDLSTPISLNHLQGSAVLGQFVDSVFAIGASAKDSSTRYLKQLKVRSVDFEYGAEHVKTCQLVKAANFLKFEFGEELPESHHLRQLSEDDLASRRQTIGKLHSEGRSQREIAKELGISVSTVNKYTKQIETNRSPCSPRSQPKGERTGELDNTEVEKCPESVRSFAPSVNSANAANTSNRGEQGRTGANEYSLCTECNLRNAVNGRVCDVCEATA